MYKALRIIHVGLNGKMNLNSDMALNFTNPKVPWGRLETWHCHNITLALALLARK